MFTHRYCETDWVIWSLFLLAPLLGIGVGIFVARKVHRRLRESLPSVFGSYSPASAKEHSDYELLKRLLWESPAPFDRHRYDPGHVTGSAFVLSADGAGLLLVHHAKLDRWLQPGGHAGWGEREPLEVALREAQEETGIRELSPVSLVPFDVDVHAIPAHGAEPAHRHFDVRYLFTAPDGVAPKASSESREVRWFPLDEAAEAGDDSVKRVVGKIRARR